MMAPKTCIHLAQNPLLKSARITPQSTQQAFDLCMDCTEIWNNDKRQDPADSQAYHVYRSIDPDLPKDQWVRLTDKPIPEATFRDTTALPGAVYYLYVVTVNALGLVSEPSEVIKIGDSDEAVDID
jgi:fibronectin type 3 domain-containing protein